MQKLPSTYKWVSHFRRNRDSFVGDHVETYVRVYIVDAAGRLSCHTKYLAVCVM